MLIPVMFVFSQALSGCGEHKEKKSKTPPTFKLAWSRHPTHSIFGAADELKLIDGKRGQRGPYELKYSIDIELILTEYELALQRYESGEIDAVCLELLDVLDVSLKRKSIAVLPIAIWSEQAHGQQYKSRMHSRDPTIRALLSDPQMQLVLLGADVFKNESGVAFVQALRETFYILTYRMINPETSEETILTIGKKYNNLELADMRNKLKSCSFIATPEDAIRVFNSPELQNTLNTISEHYLASEIIAKRPDVTFGDTVSGDNILHFDSNFPVNISVHSMNK